MAEELEDHGTDKIGPPLFRLEHNHWKAAA